MIDNKKIEVIIPALNEEETIKNVICDIPDFVDRIIVVDNGSTDNTSRIAKSAGAHVVKSSERGYGNACLKGISVLFDDTDIVVFLDGDYSDYPDEMKLLIKPIIKNNSDLVIGVRKTKSKRALTSVQKFGNRFSCFLIKILYGYKYNDLGPFRAITLKSLKLLEMKDKTYGWTVEMQIKAVKYKLSISEVNVNYRERGGGKSKVSGTIKGIFFAGLKITYYIFKEKFKRKRKSNNN